MKTTLFLAVITTSLLIFQLTSAAPDGVCDLSPMLGPCQAYMPRYFYNKKTGKCQEFIYGGCLGNKNNFLDRGSCEKTCK